VLGLPGRVVPSIKCAEQKLINLHGIVTRQAQIGRLGPFDPVDLQGGGAVIFGCGRIHLHLQVNAVPNVRGQTKVDGRVVGTTSAEPILVVHVKIGDAIGTPHETDRPAFGVNRAATRRGRVAAQAVQLAALDEFKIGPDGIFVEL
jgi:hypothetical protein